MDPYKVVFEPTNGARVVIGDGFSEFVFFLSLGHILILVEDETGIVAHNIAQVYEVVIVEAGYRLADYPIGLVPVPIHEEQVLLLIKFHLREELLRVEEEYGLDWEGLTCLEGELVLGYVLAHEVLDVAEVRVFQDDDEGEYSQVEQEN